MEDYPRTLRELESRFATEEACREYLASLRWPNGFVCPKCGSGSAWWTARGLQMAVSREHLDYYLDEFTFRFNRRASRHRGKLFYRLLEQAVAVDPAPYAAMVRGVRGPRKKGHHYR